MVEPIEELTHDHRELSGLLLAVHEAMGRVEAGDSKLDDELHEISDGIEAFREALLEHFAVEQETLLPFVVTRLPATRERTEAIMAEHDRMAEALTALRKELGTLEARGEAAFATWTRHLASFEAVYADHARTELAFLREVARELSGDPAAVKQLTLLLAEA